MSYWTISYTIWTWIKAGTKVNKLLSIQKEIALNLAAKDVRIQAPIPGKVLLV